MLLTKACPGLQGLVHGKRSYENYVKVGSRNTVLANALAGGIPLVTDKPTIIFGGDVIHQPPGEDSSALIVAVIASMDWHEFTKYKGLVSAQTHREEMIKDLYTQINTAQGDIVRGGMIRNLLISFALQIYVSRDGEGQFSHVIFNEVDAIYKACQSLEEDYLPSIIFVVDQKRHHTRLFAEVHGGNQTNKSGNILPSMYTSLYYNSSKLSYLLLPSNISYYSGTVVDRMVRHQTEYDFYQCNMKTVNVMQVFPLWLMLVEPLIICCLSCLVRMFSVEVG